ncbi:MAG TPA: GNAT family N-acetyltransferase [Acidimicrobiia bacterium]|nr:GNAT family N-acetyltransferase [Acidimicrobiia bacterium]
MVHVRRADAGDAEVVAGIHFLANWRAYGELTGAPSAEAHERGDWAEQQLEGYRRLWHRQLAAGQSGNPIFVVETDQQVAGFCEAAGNKARGIGEIVGLYIDPEHWREGLGRALVTEVVRWFKQRRVATVVLWVLEPAVEARAFYKALGWKPDGARRAERSVVEGALTGVRYRRDLT